MVFPNNKLGTYRQGEKEGCHKPEEMELTYETVAQSSAQFDRNPLSSNFDSPPPETPWDSGNEPGKHTFQHSKNLTFADSLVHCMEIKFLIIIGDFLSDISFRLN